MLMTPERLESSKCQEVGAGARYRGAGEPEPP